MRLLKYIIVGAAVGYGINYVTKKGPDGRSILDDLTDKAPDWIEDAKKFVALGAVRLGTSSTEAIAAGERGIAAVGAANY